MIRRPVGDLYPSNLSHIDEDVPILSQDLFVQPSFSRPLYGLRPCQTIGLFPLPSSYMAQETLTLLG